MIYCIKGYVDSILDDSVVIESKDGIGFEVICNKKTLSQLKEEEFVKLITYTHLTQDNVSLFGFLEQRELSLFKKLIGVNGVGCKMAISILELESESLVEAILKDDFKVLTKIKGVGSKTAQRIILELKGKVKMLEFSGKKNEAIEDAKYALAALGYNVRDIESVLDNINKSMSVECIIKYALAELNG